MQLRYYFLFFLLYVTPGPAQIPAFPGAEGWGAASVGGRGGIVLQVTNLNDSGPGSFRDAVSTPGARTIVFRVGGIIDLQSEVQVTNPYVYIAGQTAPGDGIVLKNFALTIFTHDVTIRGLRIRTGNNYPLLSPDNRDCLDVESGSYNVIIDHCSFSWGSDENTSVLDSAVNSVTIQWCIISEALYANMHPKGFHSMGLLIGYDASKTSVHHNLFAHNGARNPLILRRTDHEFVSNLVYDWKYKSDLYEQGTQFLLDFTGNYYKPFSDNPFPELPFGVDFDSSSTNGSKMYITNNFFSAGEYFITAQQLSQMGGNAVIFSPTSLLSVPSTVTFHPPFAARDTVLAWAGALHPQRDTTDKRVLKSVTDSTGGLIDCIGTIPQALDSGNVLGATDSTIIYSELGKLFVYSTASRKIVITSGTGAGQVRYGVDEQPIVLDTLNKILEGKISTLWTTRPDASSAYKFYAGCNNVLSGYPAYASGTPPADSDNDGMPDAWELAHGLNPSDASDRNGLNLSGQGYTNLEVYLNGFYSPVATGIAETKKDPVSITVMPNPFSTIAVIKISERLASGVLTVYNSLGQPVKQMENLSGQTIILHREGLPNGLYFVRIIQGGKQVVSEKIMIKD